MSFQRVNDAIQCTVLAASIKEDGTVSASIRCVGQIERLGKTAILAGETTVMTLATEKPKPKEDTERHRPDFESAP